MITYLEKLGVSTSVLTIFLVALLTVEGIKLIQYLWGVFAPKILHIKTSLSVHHEMVELVHENNKNYRDLLELMNENKEDDKKRYEEQSTINEEQSRINSMQQEFTAQQMEFNNKQNEMNQSIREEIAEVRDLIKDVQEVVISSQIQQMRTTILNFASEISENKGNRVFPKERYDSVLETYKEYTNVIKKRELINDQITISHEIILEDYKRSLGNNQFSDNGIDY